MKKFSDIIQCKWVWLACVLLIAVLLYRFNPAETAMAPKCVFKLVTGYDCPGCGFQRAAHAALHGNWAEAIRHNFFLLYALPYLIALMLTEWCLNGKRKEKWRRILESRNALMFYVISFCLWGIVRNIFHW